MRRFSRARGIILGFNRVLPEAPGDFAPNADLQVTPEFLAFAIGRLRRLGYELVGMDEAARRVMADVPQTRFAVLSFDGGWRDTLRHALPVLRQERAPFMLYVTTALADGVGIQWRQALEEIVGAQTALAVTRGSETEYLPAATTAEKRAAYGRLARRFDNADEAERDQQIAELAAQYGVDLGKQTKELALDWSELTTFAEERLCTLGARGVRGYAPALLTPAGARAEIEQSVRILQAQFGEAPRHFAYVGEVGDREIAIARELGLTTAVTQRPGGIYARHRGALLALPRVLMRGGAQGRWLFDALVTPAAYALSGR